MGALLSTISFLLSALFEHSLVNLLGTLLCLFLAEYRLFSSIGWIESISHYLPTSYVDFQNVIIGGDIFSPLASEQVTFMNGILTLGIWSIVLLFIGMGTIYIKELLKHKIIGAVTKPCHRPLFQINGFLE